MSLIAINVIGDEITTEEDLIQYDEENKQKVNQVIKDFMPEGYYGDDLKNGNDVDPAVLGAVNRSVTYCFFSTVGLWPASVFSRDIIRVYVPLALYRTLSLYTGTES